MNTKVVTGIVVVLALAVIAWWYWAMMMPAAIAPAETMDESGVSAPVSDEEARTEIIGTWQSKQDSRFMRAFMADGTVTDSYEGVDEATMTGTWSIVADPSLEQQGLPAVGDSRVLKIQFPEEVLYFAITGLSATDLSMIYLMGNGSLEFTRIQ